MKPTTRRLGRGLGAFLDFGPADADGAARVSGVITAPEATSVLHTSAPAAVVPAAPPPSPPPPPATSPVPAASAPTPAVDDRPFIDDVVLGLTFPDVEIE